MISGRQTLIRIRATKPSKVIELNRQNMMALLQSDAELWRNYNVIFYSSTSRVINAGIRDVVLIGSIHSPSTFRIKDF